jgi:hypothetical protein
LKAWNFDDDGGFGGNERNVPEDVWSERLDQRNAA